MYKISSLFLITILTLTTGFAQSSNESSYYVDCETFETSFDISKNQSTSVTFTEEIRFGNGYVIVRDVYDSKKYVLDKFDSNFDKIESLDFSTSITSDGSVIQAIKALSDRLIIISTLNDKKSKVKVISVQTLKYQDLSLSKRTKICFAKFNTQLGKIEIQSSITDHFVVRIEEPYAKEGPKSSYFAFDENLELLYDFSKIVNDTKKESMDNGIFFYVHNIFLTTNDELVALAFTPKRNSSSPSSNYSGTIYKFTNHTQEHYILQKELVIDTNPKMVLKLDSNNVLYGGGYCHSKNIVSMVFLSFNLNMMEADIESGTVVPLKEKPEVNDILKLPNDEFLMISRDETNSKEAYNSGRHLRVYEDLKIIQVDRLGEITWAKTIETKAAVDYNLSNAPIITIVQDESILLIYTSKSFIKKQFTVVVSEINYNGEIKTSQLVGDNDCLNGILNIYKIDDQELIGISSFGDQKFGLNRLLFEE